MRAFGAIWVGGLLLEIAAGGMAVWLAGEHGPALLALLVNLLVAARFAVTLRPGTVPLITRYARLDPCGLPADCEGYTRGLTAAWVVLLVIFASLHAASASGAWRTGDVALWQSLVMSAFFLGEHPVRAWLFPQLGRVTPLRTLRCIWGARHAA